MFNWSFLVKRTIHISHIYGFLHLFQFEPCFLTNSELITNPITSLSNSASTVIPSCVSTLSNPIFTVTSLKRSPLSRLQQDVLFITLLSIANLLLLLRSNWDPLDLCPLLNYYCPLQFPSSNSYPFSYSYSVLLNIQNPHRHNNSFLCQHPWHMDFFKQTLPSVEDIPLPSLSSPLSLLEQTLLLPAEKVFPTSSAILVVIVLLVSVPAV